MGRIVLPKEYATHEFMVAVNFNHLLNAFLRETRHVLKEMDSDSAIVFFPEQTAFHLNAIRDCLSVQNEASSVAEALMTPEWNFFRIPEMAIFTTDVWLTFLALDFKTCGHLRMISDQMIALFPEIFEPTIIYGRDVLCMLESIEKTLPPGEKIPREALSILPIIAA